jgi:TfoX/Sxy family transcriptional regulator of competence genes
MAYNQNLADRVRNQFEGLENVEEKEMMGGWVIMYNDKMCVGVIKDELMCRIDPDMQKELVEENGCSVMTMNKKKMNGYVLVEESAIQTQKELTYWIHLALDFNKFAKSSRKVKIKKTV